MKTYLLIITGLCLALNAKAQEKVINKVSTVLLPKGSQNVGQSAFETYGKRNFKRITAPANNSNSFIVDNSLMVSIRELKVSSLTKKSLEKWKSQLEATYQQSGGILDISKIDTVNGNRFYFFEDHEGEEYKVFFYSEDIDDKKLSGFIAYKLKDRERAHQYLYTLLKDIKLKK
jgi:hypothetical protein